MTNFTSVLFNTQVNSLKHDGHISTFINTAVAKGLAGESNIITVALLQSAYFLVISSDTFKL